MNLSDTLYQINNASVAMMRLPQPVDCKKARPDACGNHDQYLYFYSVYRSSKSSTR